jgi:hypothetical protein
VTSEDLRSELDRQPFSPVRIHLVSGKTVEVTIAGTAWMLQNSVMIFQDPGMHERYDVIALRNIERLEQLAP